MESCNIRLGICRKVAWIVVGEVCWLKLTTRVARRDEDVFSGLGHPFSIGFRSGGKARGILGPVVVGETHGDDATAVLRLADEGSRWVEG